MPEFDTLCASSAPALLAVSGGAVATAVATLVLGLLAGFFGARLLGGRTVQDARREAEDVRARAQAEGETLKKQLELDARNEQARRREAVEKELDADRDAAAEQQRRIQKREDLLDRKLETLNTREKKLHEDEEEAEALLTKNRQRDKDLKRRLADLEKSEAEHTEAKTRELLRISHLNPEEAKREALEVLQQQCDREATQIIRQSQERAQERSKEDAQKILLEAIQRFASEHTAANTTNAVAVEDESMKGRIIGKEGRNIRAFEQATGVNVVVDDTPGQIQVSSFDPVRRAAATEALRLLVQDGRIHPTSIEETAKKTFAEFDEKIVKFGKDAAMEVNLPDLHPRVNETMGRLQYRTSYGQNILRHSVEVAFLSQVIADELGLDGALARRCGYLHDIGKALDHDVEGGHPRIGADFLRRLGEKNDAVLNAVEGHHGDVVASTVYTPIVMAADAISGARPGARRETLEKYIKRLKELESITAGVDGVKEAYAIQAGREVRVIVDPQNIDDGAAHRVARSVAKNISEKMTFPGEIKVTVLRELRTVEYAR